MAERAGQTGRRSGKSAAAFRTISEVAEALDVQQHVLRFWETKFSHVRPLKRGGGRRYYRPEDVALLKRIRVLLYEDGYTIRGVQRLLRESGAKALIAAAEATDAAPERVVAAADPTPAPKMPGAGPAEAPPPEVPPAANGAAEEIGLSPAVRGELEQLRDELRLLKKDLDQLLR